MKIVISPNLNVPLNEQVYSQIVRGITSGEIAAGECLPSIRFVARELRIGIITVKTAYEKLEADGFIETVAGKGCFVRKLEEKAPPEKLRLSHIRDRLKNEIAYYKSLAIPEQDLIDIIHELYKL